jgi:hypothetical protein
MKFILSFLVTMILAVANGEEFLFRHHREGNPSQTGTYSGHRGPPSTTGAPHWEKPCNTTATLTLTTAALTTTVVTPTIESSLYAVPLSTTVAPDDLWRLGSAVPSMYPGYPHADCTGKSQPNLTPISRAFPRHQG